MTRVLFTPAGDHFNGSETKELAVMLRTISPGTKLQEITAGRPMRLTLPVACRRPGNVITHINVSFEIHHHENYFRAVPVCDENCRRLADLPPDFSFGVVRGRLQANHPATSMLAWSIIRSLAASSRLVLPA